MGISRYESKKPDYQNNQPSSRSKPPKGSVAVFEWETFSPLTDYSDASLAKVFKQISRDIIERPYHYDPHRVFNAQGKKAHNPFTPANNSAPPEKIPGVAVYKQNHGTGHALRQMVYTNALIEKIAQEGNSKGKEIAQKVNNNPQLKSALKLAAYCKRIGRAFDHEKDHAGKGMPTIYSKRSADMFARMAKELGYSDDLIKIIRDSMLEPAPKDSATLNSYATIDGINGKDLRHFSQNILMAAHMADLTRIFTVKRKYIETSLKYYFEPAKCKEVSQGLIEMACTANAMTGNAVAKQEEGVNHQPKKSLDGKKLVEVVTNLDKAMDDLAHLKLNAPGAAPAIGDNVAVDKQKLQTKTVFAFDIDDTLIREHSFRVKGGPIFDKDEMAKIKKQMAEAIKNGHEVWIVTANTRYTKEPHMEILFNPDPDNLLGKIKFYNAKDIGRELNIPRDRLGIVHSQGKKGEFLEKKIDRDPALKNYKVNCVLFDDTQKQIDSCPQHGTDRIKIKGFRVDDYKAQRKERPTPTQSLSAEFANMVKSAGVVAEKTVQPKPDVVAKPDAIPKPHVAPKPDAIPKPHVAPKPDVVAKPDVIPKPHVAPKPHAVPKPDMAHKPHPAKAAHSNSHQRMAQLLVKPKAPDKTTAIMLKTMAITCLNMNNKNLTPSINRNNGKTNLLMSFSSREEAEFMSRRLRTMGVGSNNKVGTNKTVFEGNKIVLTEKDAAIIQQYHQSIKAKIDFLHNVTKGTVNIQPSTDKNTGQTNIVLSFASSREAEQMTNQLFNMGINSNATPGNKKNVFDNSIVLTPKDVAAMRQQYNNIKQERQFLQDVTHGAAAVLPSKNNKTGQTNALVVFKTKEEARQFTADLAREGIVSRTNGQPKSVQSGNGVILTPRDCEKLEQRMNQNRQLGLG